MINNEVHENILGLVGNTPIVSLNKLAPHLDVNLYGKCEYLNPAGSIKDRISVYIVDQAEKRGELKPGGTIIEATSGNTGMGLAMVASLRGYKCIFVMADKQSKEKQLSLKALGAKVIVCPTDVDPEDERSYYSVAKRLTKEIPNSFYANQYYNQDNPRAHYHSTGPEIYKQMGDSLNYLILGLGTGGTVSGTGKYLKEKLPKMKIIGADPIGSIYFDLFYKGKMPKAHSYLVEGIGEDFLPKTINLQIIDDILQVTDQESFIMARRLARECGLLVGGSSGSAVACAIKYFENNPATNKQSALIILVDSFTRYVSKYLDDEWMMEHKLL